MSETPRRHLFVDAGTLVAAGVGATLVARDAHSTLGPLVAGYVLFVLVAARMLSLGVHELGHLVAAALAGWRWDLYKVGPLLLSRESGSLAVTLRGGRRFKAAGLVVTHPVSPAEDTRNRRLLMLSGGPVASVLLALSAVVAWQLVTAPFARIAFGVTAVFSAIVSFTTLLPFVSSGNPSDGALIFALLRDQPVARPRHAR